MKKIVRSIAVLMALLMVVTALPLSVFAEAGGSAPAYEADGIVVETRVDGFQLIVDGGNGKDDANVDFTAADDADADEYMGAVPSGTDLPTAYDSENKGLKLDWDDMFPNVQNVDRKIMYTLARQRGKMVEVTTGDTTVLEPVYNPGWQETSIWDGQLIKVLVVYPYVDSSADAAKNIMSGWLESDLDSGEGLAGKGLFDIETIRLDDPDASNTNTFNDKCAGDANYLKDSNGNYKYDVILFGTWDTNGSTKKHADLTADASADVRAFIQNGSGGVVFGHDTVCGATNLTRSKDGFNSFADELGILLLGNHQVSNAVVASEASDKASVVKEGVITSYPWEISDNLTIPETHALFQITGGDLESTVWMRLEDGAADKDSIYGLSAESISASVKRVYKDHTGNDFVSDAYLITNRNVAFIQTGHSNGSATDDERKVFANILFYLQQNLLDNYSVDHDFRDVEYPVVNESKEEVQATVAIDENSFDPAYGSYYPGGEYDGVQTFDATFTFSGSDIGTPYKYKVEAIDGRTEPQYDYSRTSNVLEVVATAYLQGYVIEINENPSMSHEDAKALVIEKTDMENGYAVDLDIKGKDNQSVTYTATDLDTSKTWYAHIIPVDNSNNAGKPVPVKIALKELLEEGSNVITDIEATPNLPVDEQGNPVDTENAFTDADGDAVYYPGNYEDIEGNEFPKRQEDDKVNVGITATVDTLKKEVVGVITLTKWAVDEDGNIKTDENGDPIVERFYTAEDLNELANINASLEFGEVFTKDITFNIDDIYNKDIVFKGEEYNDYLTNGEFTVNLDWYEKNKDGSLSEKPVVSDSTDFTIVRPDYKVTFNYKDTDEDGNIIEASTDTIVKYGDAAEVPEEVPEYVADEDYLYVLTGWDEDFSEITGNLVVNAEYRKISLGHAPEQPTVPPVVDDDKDVELIRLGGETRVETAVEISKEGWPEADVVILATANLFPDAMAGVPLAKAVDAPILLTVNGEKLEDVVKAEIARLNPEKVYILGQTAAVNANIEEELKAIYEVERVGGKDRFGTAVMIAYELEEIYGVKADAVFFVRSDLFPDALSVSPIAAIGHDPILYVAPNGDIDELTVEYSKTIGTEATIVGGDAAVSEKAEINIKSIFADVDRIYGNDRYATSVELCNEYASIFTGDGTALATGLKFPDALTGGAFAAKKNIPVLLVNGSVSPELSIYLANRPITRLYVFGGEAAVSDKVAYDALEYCRYLYAE